MLAFQVSLVAQMVKNLPPTQKTWVRGSGRSSGGGHGNPLQYSFLENSMGGKVWWGTVHGGRTELDTTERLNSSSSSSKVGLLHWVQKQPTASVFWTKLWETDFTIKKKKIVDCTNETIWTWTFLLWKVSNYWLKFFNRFNSILIPCFSSCEFWKFLYCKEQSHFT